MKKRTFSKEERLKTQEEAKKNGVQSMLDTFGIYPAKVLADKFYRTRKNRN